MIDEVMMSMINHKEISPTMVISDEAKLNMADNLDKWIIRDGELDTQEIGVATMNIKSFVIGYYWGCKNSL